MSTPTPAGTKPAPAGPQNAATPQSLAHLAAFSSPAQRTQAGKSPFGTAGHLPGSTSTTTAMNHPTTGSSASGAGRLLASSPAAAMLNFDSPAGMALSLSNMGGLDGSIGMGISMSGLSALNLGTSMGGRGDDEDRRKRLEAVVNLLKARSGRVCPEGLELLSKRVGMEVLLEPPDGPTKTGTRECAIAGGSVLIDVGFASDHSVSRVDLSFPTSSDAVNRHLGSASRILQESLALQPGMSPITLNLDKFSKNLERLAKLDHLNGPMSSQDFNCFEAIAGVYTSLKKLYELEKEVALALLDANENNREEKAEREVMCKKSGRPVVNARHTIGLSLDYWMTKRHVFMKKTPPETMSTDAMEVDSQALKEGPTGHEKGIFSLSVECESSATEIYPSVRISDAWLSDQVVKPADDVNDVFGPVLDWLEPPPTYLGNPNAQPDSMVLDGSNIGKLPSIRFVAKLDPPLVVPLQVAQDILQTVGIQIQQDPMALTLPTYHGLLLNLEIDPLEFLGPPKPVTSQQKVVRKGANGNEEIRTHINTFVPINAEYGRILEDIPFAHPKQLVQIIPTLRQWAMANTLITELVASPFSSPTANMLSSGSAGSLPLDVKFDTNFCRFGVFFPQNPSASLNGQTEYPELTLVNLLESEGEGAQDSAPIGLNPAQSNGVFNSSRQVSFDVLLNGNISISNESVFNTDIVPAQNGVEDKELDFSHKLARSLDIAGDLDIWVEWIDKVTG